MPAQMQFTSHVMLPDNDEWGEARLKLKPLWEAWTKGLDEAKFQHDSKFHASESKPTTTGTGNGVRRRGPAPGWKKRQRETPAGIPLTGVSASVDEA